jgi:hypothetical protein
MESAEEPAGSLHTSEWPVESGREIFVAEIGRLDQRPDFIFAPETATGMRRADGHLSGLPADLRCR